MPRHSAGSSSPSGKSKHNSTVSIDSQKIKDPLGFGLKSQNCPGSKLQSHLRLSTLKYSLDFQTGLYFFVTVQLIYRTVNEFNNVSNDVSCHSYRSIFKKLALRRNYGLSRINDQGHQDLEFRGFVMDTKHFDPDSLFLGSMSICQT